MSIGLNEFERLADEHTRLMARYARTQEHCSRLIDSQARQIAALQAEAMQLRAQVIIRDTALAWAREDRDALEASAPDLPKRASQARHIQTLSARIQDLLRERAAWQRQIGVQPPAQPRVIKAGPRVQPRSVLCVGPDASSVTVDRQVIEMAGGRFLHHDELDTDDAAALEASLRAADLVICQTGCLSHNAYWRVRDHCKRTGKQCVLVDQPRAVDLIRSVTAGTTVPAED